MRVRAIQSGDRDEWRRMRTALWPDDHTAEVERFFAGERHPSCLEVLVAERENGRLGGFLEAGERSYAEGCLTTPVAYVEGWYVDPDLRGHGIGRRLIEAVEAWAADRGHTEIASDAALDNDSSIDAHRALGFAEVGRAVNFRKTIGSS